jgi:hypothetical protein
MPNDFMREYEKHLNDPAVRLKRHLKLARWLQCDPRDLVDTADPEGMAAAVELYMRALEGPKP